jgi:hypothetical protein
VTTMKDFNNCSFVLSYRFVNYQNSLWDSLNGHVASNLENTENATILVIWVSSKTDIWESGSRTESMPRDFSKLVELLR